MNICNKIGKQLKKCPECGNIPIVYYRDFNGEYLIGDEYSIECKCGIHTRFFEKEDTIKIWNRIYLLSKKLKRLNK